jgi:hypothetical protein
MEYPLSTVIQELQIIFLGKAIYLLRAWYRNLEPADVQDIPF